MHTIRLNLKKRSYNIYIGNRIISLLGQYIRKLNLGDAAYVITNALIKNNYGSRLSKSLRDAGLGVRFKVVPDTEKTKSLGYLSLIMEDLANYDKKRKIFIIAFGGGVIGDLVGFVASIYKRGTSYVQVPTTLLAQVDSSIGGKTAIDLIQGKNLLGAFYQPRLVLSDLALLKSLDLRQVRSGLAEVIKYGVIKDPQLFAYLEKNYQDIFSLKLSALEYIVWRCSYIKARIVEQDECETKGIRTILNFGHTLGHAIEAAGNYKSYNHGEAVALGMLLACELSKKLGLLTEKVSARIENLIQVIGLPQRIEKISLSDIIDAYYRDKKFIGPKNRFVLLEDIGLTKIVENLPFKLINETLKKRMK